MVDVGGAAEIFESVCCVAIGEDERAVEIYAEAVGEASLFQFAGGLIHEGGGDLDGAAGRSVGVVVDDESALVAETIGVGENIFIYSSMVVPEIIEQKVMAFSEESAVLEQGRNLVLMARDEAFVRVLVHASAFELHAVALGVALNLTVAEHGEAGKSCEQGAGAEVFVSCAELVDGGPLVGI